MFLETVSLIKFGVAAGRNNYVIVGTLRSFGAKIP
jgi:hypothetical protein